MTSFSIMSFSSLRRESCSALASCVAYPSHTAVTISPMGSISFTPLSSWKWWWEHCRNILRKWKAQHYSIVMTVNVDTDGCVSYFWVMRGGHHDSNGGFCLFGPQSCQKPHAEHDVIQMFGVSAESSCAILQHQALRLRMQLGLLRYFLKLSHLWKRTLKQLSLIHLFWFSYILYNRIIHYDSH